MAANTKSEIVTVIRDHKVVAHGSGKLGSKVELTHRGRLSGKYTVLVQIPGVTTISRTVKL